MNVAAQSVNFSVLWHRKKTLLVSGLAVACLAFMFSKILPLQYAGEGGMVVESPISEGAQAAADTGTSVVQTQIDVLQSKGVIARVVHDQKITVNDLAPKYRLPEPILRSIGDAVGYAKQMWHAMNGDTVTTQTSAADEATDYLQKYVQISAKNGSKLILLRFAGGSPIIAASVVNGIMRDYLATDNQIQVDKVDKVNEYIAQQSKLMQDDISTAQDRLAQFVRRNNLPELQGGGTSAALQLSHDEEALSVAHQMLAVRKAALDTLQKSGVGAAEETLESPTIQALKNYEAQIIQQVSTLSTIDPRRAPLQQGLAGIRAQIAHEMDLIRSSIERNVSIAQAKVNTLELAVRTENGQSQDMSNANVTQKQLVADVETKRQAFLAFLTQAGQLRGGAEQSLSAHILFQAVPPVRPVNTFATLSLLLGFMSGITISAGSILFRDTFATRISSSLELEMATGMPSFHSLPDIVQSRQGVIAARKNTVSLITETFRSLWIAMRSQKPGEGTVALITSSEVGEGKTMTAMAIAQQFADDGMKVLLVDADLRRPQLSTVLKANPTNFVEMVMDGTSTLQDAIYRSKFEYDCLLSNGTARNPARILTSEPFQRMLREAKKDYDFVILDSPPVLHVIDPVLMSDLCDYILFIVESGRVPRELVSEAIRRFSDRGRDHMLTLLTRVKPRKMDKRDFYSGYESTRLKAIDEHPHP
jgi:polysaccharide biosynthesis transport protein